MGTAGLALIISLAKNVMYFLFSPFGSAYYFHVTGKLNTSSREYMRNLLPLPWALDCVIWQLKSHFSTFQTVKESSFFTKTGVVRELKSHLHTALCNPSAQHSAQSHSLFSGPEAKPNSVCPCGCRQLAPVTSQYVAHLSSQQAKPCSA